MSVPPARWPEAASTFARTYGLRGVALRVLHESRRRAGAFRRIPRHGADLTTPAPHPYWVDPAALAAATDRTAALARADRVTSGEYEAYRWSWRTLPSLPDDWHRSPGARQAFPSDLPWWSVPHAAIDAGDIKDVWEPGRFAWVYDLVRGWLLSGDTRYAEAFHRLFADWCRSSPPFLGAQWACGQETAIRAVALLYAEANLVQSPASTPERMASVASILSASGERIEDAIGYGISQRNNHAVSEAVGLIVLGERFRDRHPDAARWLRHGHRLLDRTVREQFAADGWYIQHSFNYLRLALDQCVIGVRALRRSGSELSASSLDRLRAAVDLLCAVIEPASGIVPNHGHNDGSFVHPVTLATYRDYRATLTTAASTLGAALPSDIAIDRESLAWVGSALPSRCAPTGDGVRTGSSGWAAARVGESFVFIRAGSYVSRPAHVDPLHIDIRMGGREVIADAGTYSYNAPPPWRNGLAAGHLHNGPVIDGEEPAARGGRFLFVLWPTARIARAEMGNREAVIEAEQPGRVSRTVRVMPDEVVVTDASIDPTARRIRVEWLLHPDADARQ
ncbi:MAG TPA: heparinase II/III family protein, partial [Gemmatimonadaceae bacterium]|nr:heparinase II/III family protein [Gemmatimonadaceae bacterium]